MARRRVHRHRDLLPADRRDADAADLHPRSALYHRAGQRPSRHPGDSGRAGRWMRPAAGRRPRRTVGGRAVGLADDGRQDRLYPQLGVRRCGPERPEKECGNPDLGDVADEDRAPADLLAGQEGQPRAVAAGGQHPRVGDVHVLADEVHVGFARSQHVFDPIGLAMGQSDRQHVALAIGGDDGFVLLAGGAATVLDHRERRKIARDRLDQRVEVLGLEVLKPDREDHRDARGVVGMVLSGHGRLRFRRVRSHYRSDMQLLCSGTMIDVTVMTRIDLRGADLSTARLRAALPRGGVDVEAALSTVRPIVDAVADRGAEAALEYGESFDGVRPPTVRVPSAELDAPLAGLDRDVRAALEVAIERTRAVHADQRRSDVTTTLGPGATVTERWVPVDRVGLYVPGGNAVYPSSVVMNVVPARAAGVGSLVVASPPQAQSQGRYIGSPHPTILAAARLLGVDEVWAVGGAQAVALMAYGGVDTDGTELLPVDMITGPGNIYVTAAKRLCRSRVGIDAEAGPTEIAILADDTADPAHVAADLISQAEHDEMAASVLVTPSTALADATDTELAAQLETTVHRQRVTTALAGRQSAIILVDDIDAGIRTVNAYAAEHLEIQTVDAAKVAAQIRSAGAIFVGAYSPVSLGDYCAGSNHVLPTAGSARHSSGLSVQTFLRGIHVVDYTEAALKDVSGHVVTLAKAEDLPAHGEAVRRRFER